MADVLVLTKTDLANAENISALQEKLTLINAGATQHHIMNGELDPAFIIDVGLFDSETKQAEPQRWLRAPLRNKTTKSSI